MPVRMALSTCQGSRSVGNCAYHSRYKEKARSKSPLSTSPSATAIMNPELSGSARIRRRSTTNASSFLSIATRAFLRLHIIATSTVDPFFTCARSTSTRSLSWLAGCQPSRYPVSSHASLYTTGKLNRRMTATAAVTVPSTRRTLGPDICGGFSTQFTRCADDFEPAALLTALIRPRP